MAFIVITFVIYFIIGFATTIAIGNLYSPPEEEAIAYGIFWPVAFAKYLYWAFWFVIKGGI